VNDSLPQARLGFQRRRYLELGDTSPAPQLGTASHQSAIGSGVHQHFFTGATTRCK